MNLCLQLEIFSLFFIVYFTTATNAHSDFKILDQNFNEVQDNELLEKLQKLDTQLKRNLFYIPTDKVVTDDQINHVIHAVSLKSNIKLADAVTAIVNVKLIKRLQFNSLTKYYASCVDVVRANASLPYLPLDLGYSGVDDLTLVGLGSAQSQTDELTYVADSSTACGFSDQSQQSLPGMNAGLGG